MYKTNTWKNKGIWCAVLGWACLIGAFEVQAAAIQQVNGSGLLTGATGVDVGGTLYEVEFVDGSCVALFDGCDAASDFDFTSLPDATLAAQALLDQVLVGAFSDAPTLLFGCGDIFCDLITPYAPGSTVKVTAFGGGDVAPSASTFPVAADTSTSTVDVYVVWTPPAAVPEPGTALLLGMGIALLPRRVR